MRPNLPSAMLCKQRCRRSTSAQGSCSIFAPKKTTFAVVFNPAKQKLSVGLVLKISIAVLGEVVETDLSSLHN